MTKQHYPLAPSKLARVIACPGSQRYPDSERSTDYATEGTQAHDLAATILAEKIAGAGRDYSDFGEMYAAASLYADYCHTWVERGAKVHYIETTLADPHDDRRGGTPDFAAVMADRTGVIVDFKYGAGVPVAAEKNPQLLEYCYLLVQRHPEIERFVVAIVQPRTAGDAIDEVDVSLAEVADHTDQVVSRSREDDFCHGDHCRWCPGVAVCPELHSIALDLAAKTFGEVTSEDNSANWPALLKAAGPLKKMLDAIPGRMLDAIRQGREFEGWKAVKATPGNRSWVQGEAETLRALAKRKIGKRVACATSLKTPTQLDREGYGDKIADLIHRPDRGYTVAPTSDKREAVSFATPTDVFEDLSFLE